MEKKHRYISRYEKEKGGGYTFCGWRLCITRHKERYVRYYSDRQYKTADMGLLVALAHRDKILADLATLRENDISEYFRVLRRRSY